MTERMKIALTVLRWSLGLVILIEAILFVMPNARHDFARSHMPDAVRGAWILVSVFVFAIIIHFLHGMYNVGNLVIYIAAAWIVVEKGN